MSLRSASEERAGSADVGPGFRSLLISAMSARDDGAAGLDRVGGVATLGAREAERIRHVIEAAIGEVFGVSQADLSRPTRGKAPIARARQAGMYLAHVACGLNLTDVGSIFARDRTTVAHACAVIEDLRDDPVFDRAVTLLEWIIPSLVGDRHAHAAAAI